LRRDGSRATVRVSFRLWNFGGTRSVEQARALHIRGHQGRGDPLIEIQPVDLLEPLSVPALEPGESHEFQATVDLPADGGPTPVLIDFAKIGGEANVSNNQWVTWFNATRR
jgi:hypothetical protein